MTTFEYAGNAGVTAVQLADDTMATVLAMVGTRGARDIELRASRAGDTPMITWETKDGRRLGMEYGDLLVSLDTDPHDYTTMSAAMFGALFKTGG